MTFFKRPPNCEHMNSIGIGGKELPVVEGLVNLSGVDSRYFGVLRAQGWEPSDAPEGYRPPEDPSVNEVSVLEQLRAVEALGDEALEAELAAAGAVLASGASRGAAVQAVLALRLEAARVLAAGGGAAEGTKPTGVGLTDPERDHKSAGALGTKGQGVANAPQRQAASKKPDGGPVVSQSKPGSTF